MKVLVTGASGFIGNHVIKELLSKDNEIIATATDISKIKEFEWYSKIKFIPYVIDGLLDERNLYSYFERPDILIHLAWQGLPNYKAFTHIEKNLFAQFYFLKNIISNGLKDITITGTCFEYGLQSGSLREDLTPMPLNSYSVAKDCLRRILGELQRECDFSLKWIRLFYMYGAGQNPNSLLSLLQKAIDGNEKEFNMSGGEQLRDYLPVEEVARIVVQIAKQKEIGGIINCCSGQPISVKKLAEKYRESRCSNIQLNLGYYPYVEYEPMEFWGDISKLNKILESNELH